MFKFGIFIDYFLQILKYSKYPYMGYIKQLNFRI